MALEKLDGRAVRGARWREGAPRSGKKLADGGGLFLLLQPNGSRLWRYKYRHGGKERVASLGGYPEIDLAEARKRHRAARLHVEAGRDPVAEKRRERETAAAAAAPTHTFNSVAEEWFAAKVEDRSRLHSARTRGILENYLYPDLAGLAIAEIEPPVALAALRKIEAAGRLATARKARQVINGVYRFAIAAGLAKYNPAAELSGAMQEMRPRHFSAITEPRDVGPLMVAIDAYEGSIVVCIALRISAFLFQRPGEIRTMKWAELDLETALWTRTGSTMKSGADHLVPLPRQAVELLRDLQPISGNSPFSALIAWRFLRDLSLRDFSLLHAGWLYRDASLDGFGPQPM